MRRPNVGWVWPSFRLSGQEDVSCVQLPVRLSSAQPRQSLIPSGAGLDNTRTPKGTGSERSEERDAYHAITSEARMCMRRQGRHAPSRGAMRTAGEGRPAVVGAV